MLKDQDTNQSSMKNIKNKNASIQHMRWHENKRHYGFKGGNYFGKMEV